VGLSPAWIDSRFILAMILSGMDSTRPASISATLVAGIAVAAVGDELVLTHPTGHTDAKTAAVLIGAPAIYLLGNLVFKRATATSRGLSHMVGLGLLAVLTLLWPLMDPLTLSAAATLVLVVATWETLSLQPRRGDHSAPET
jgi:low temperature requirement protein LtrA